MHFLLTISQNIGSFGITERSDLKDTNSEECHILNKTLFGNLFK